MHLYYPGRWGMYCSELAWVNDFTPALQESCPHSGCPHCSGAWECPTCCPGTGAVQLFEGLQQGKAPPTWVHLGLPLTMCQATTTPRPSDRGKAPDACHWVPAALRAATDQSCSCDARRELAWHPSILGIGWHPKQLGQPALVLLSSLITCNRTSQVFYLQQVCICMCRSLGGGWLVRKEGYNFFK